MHIIGKDDEETINDSDGNTEERTSADKNQ